MYVNGLAGLLLLLFLATGCKKEDETAMFEQFAFDSQEVLDLLPLGLRNSTDQFARECVGMIEIALDMSDFIDNLEVPPEARKTAKNGTTDTWSWTWDYKGEVWKYYLTYDEDNSKMYWTIRVLHSCFSPLHSGNTKPQKN